VLFRSQAKARVPELSGLDFEAYMHMVDVFSVNGSLDDKVGVCFRAFDLLNEGEMSMDALLTVLDIILRDCGIQASKSILESIVVRTFRSRVSTLRAGYVTPTECSLQLRPLSENDFRYFFIRSPTLMDIMTTETWRLADEIVGVVPRTLSSIASMISGKPRGSLSQLRQDPTEECSAVGRIQEIDQLPVVEDLSKRLETSIMWRSPFVTQKVVGEEHSSDVSRWTPHSKNAAVCFLPDDEPQIIPFVGPTTALSPTPPHNFQFSLSLSQTEESGGELSRTHSRNDSACTTRELPDSGILSARLRHGSLRLFPGPIRNGRRQSDPNPAAALLAAAFERSVLRESDSSGLKSNSDSIQTDITGIFWNRTVDSVSEIEREHPRSELLRSESERLGNRRSHRNQDSDSVSTDTAVSNRSPVAVEEIVSKSPKGDEFE